jgi:hypothetical protein
VDGGALLDRTLPETPQAEGATPLKTTPLDRYGWIFHRAIPILPHDPGFEMRRPPRAIRAARITCGHPRGTDRRTVFGGPRVARGAFHRAMGASIGGRIHAHHTGSGDAHHTPGFGAPKVPVKTCDDHKMRVESKIAMLKVYWAVACRLDVCQRHLASCGCFLPHLLGTAGRPPGATSARRFATVSVHPATPRPIENRGLISDLLIPQYGATRSAAIVRRDPSGSHRRIKNRPRRASPGRLL